MNASNANRIEYISAEAIAQWFFRLNGCLTIDNFVLHPESGGSARTEVDVIALRLPYRQELDRRPMPDFPGLVRNDAPLLVFADVKYRGPCRLNPAWISNSSENLLALLKAIGPFPDHGARDAVAALYGDGRYEGESGSVFLCSIGETTSEKMSENLPGALQWTWGKDLLPFIFTRMHDYHMQKANVQQWDETGLTLKRLALKTSVLDEFLADVRRRMIN
jgi:hypothetical protein